jgi:hypothetical protein
MRLVKIVIKNNSVQIISVDVFYMKLIMLINGTGDLLTKSFNFWSLLQFLA